VLQLPSPPTEPPQREASEVQLQPCCHCIQHGASVSSQTFRSVRRMSIAARCARKQSTSKPPMRRSISSDRLHVSRGPERLSRLLVLTNSIDVFEILKNN
jgi:hypothetical protein